MITLRSVTFRSKIMFDCSQSAMIQSLFAHVIQRKYHSVIALYRLIQQVPQVLNFL